MIMSYLYYLKSKGPKNKKNHEEQRSKVYIDLKTERNKILHNISEEQIKLDKEEIDRRVKA